MGFGRLGAYLPFNIQCQCVGSGGARLHQMMSPAQAQDDWIILGVLSPELEA